MYKFLSISILTIFCFGCDVNDKYHIANYSLSANEISNEFIHNARIVSKKYFGKRIEIEGFILSNNSSNNSIPNLILEGENKKAIKCNLNFNNISNEDKHKILLFEVGQKVKLNGIFSVSENEIILNNSFVNLSF